MSSLADPSSPGTAAARSPARTLKIFCEMIKISHSIFALPFAVAAAFLAARGLPPWPVLLKVVLACFFARTAAMSFNRWADARIDGRNPRTRTRAIPAGLLSSGAVLAAALIFAGLFAATAAWINMLAFQLSPLALLVLFGYSYTKRFTPGSHLVLGLALGLSPVGAWIAVRGELATFPCLIGLAVLFWTAGFDVIYACQDVDFDRREKLFSIPARWGVPRALWAARVFHAVTIGLLTAAGMHLDLGLHYFSGVLGVAVLIVYEHSLVRAGDLSKVNVAFFNLNGIISIVFMTGSILEATVQ